jgi:hypothetical protein
MKDVVTVDATDPSAIPPQHANDNDDNTEEATTTTSNATSETKRRADRHKRYIESILNGTDEITIAAKTKRTNRVGTGMFVEANIHYFGDTVVLWDMREFMNVSKWREDAMRRSRGMKKDNVVIRRGGVGSGGSKRKGNNQSDDVVTARCEGKEESDDDVAIRGIQYLSRKKRFRALCKQWYQSSLLEG